MPTLTSTSYGQAESAASLLDLFFKDYSDAPFAISFWDGSVWSMSSDKPAFTIYLRTPDAWATLSEAPNDLALGTKYIDGEITIEGDLYLVLRTLPAIEKAIRTSIPTSAASLRAYAATLADHIGRFLYAGNLHSQKRDANSISYHYDKPSSFYKLFLGPTMVYSCAYFRAWNNTLDQAQRDKMDLICKKLALRPGERFLDIGCGWGSLVLHAREHYDVSSHGVSLSGEQVRYAEERIKASKQNGHCKVYWSDFRDLDEVHLPFDKLASVGMCEHVGKKHIDAYFREAHKLLHSGGLFLNHGITRRAGIARRGPSFIDRYVFPDGELLTLTEMVRAAEDAGFEVRDVEDLREHYEETLHRWVHALRANEADAVRLTDPKTVRIWELYMTGSAEAFRRGDIAVYQLLLSKNARGQSSAAKTREQWYCQADF